jgi:hypothetical protein
MHPIVPLHNTSTVGLAVGVLRWVEQSVNISHIVSFLL